MGSSKLGWLTGILALSPTLSAQAREPKQREVIAVEEVTARPEGYRRETRLRRGPVIAGGILTGAGGLMLFTGLQQRAALDSHSHQQAPGSGGEVFLIMGSLTLAAGLPLLAYGLLSPRDVYVRQIPVDVAFVVSPSKRSGGVVLSLRL